MVSYQVERERFFAVMAKEVPTATEHDVRAFLRDAATLARLAVVNCNRELTKAEDKRDDAATARVLARAKALGLEADVDGDPRGYVVKLHLPGGSFNTWGGKESGYGVPTRSY